MRKSKLRLKHISQFEELSAIAWTPEKPGKLTVRPQALADLREAALYLNEQRPYLERRLLSSAHQTLRELLLMPRSGSVKFYPGSRPELR